MGNKHLLFEAAEIWGYQWSESSLPWQYLGKIWLFSQNEGPLSGGNFPKVVDQDTVKDHGELSLMFIV